MNNKPKPLQLSTSSLVAIRNKNRRRSRGFAEVSLQVCSAWSKVVAASPTTTAITECDILSGTEAVGTGRCKTCRTTNVSGARSTTEATGVSAAVDDRDGVWSKRLEPIYDVLAISEVSDLRGIDGCKEFFHRSQFALLMDMSVCVCTKLWDWRKSGHTATSEVFCRTRDH